MPYSLGVDVGATFTAAAISRDGAVEMVSLGMHELVVPTVVFAKGDELAFGDAALLRGQAEPAGLAREFERRFGDAVPLVLSGAPYPAARLVALCIQWVVETVEVQLGERAQALVVTHPASWTEFQVHLLRRSLDEVRLGSAVLLTEPEAAALDFAAVAPVQPGEMHLVYDLGGSTFGVTVLRKEQDGFSQVGEATGIDRLGGIDFDEALFQYVAQRLPKGVMERVRADPEHARAIDQLRRTCIAAKEALSTEDAVDVPVVLPELSTTVHVTRSAFEEMIRPTLNQTVDVVRRTLAGAGVTPDDVSGALMVGGSSRIPLASEVVASELGVVTRVDAHPKLVVARGAARYAGAVASATPGSRDRRWTARRRRRTVAVVVAAGAVVALGAGAIALALTGDGGGSAADETGSTTDASTTSSSNTGTIVPGPVVPTLSLAPPIGVPPFPDSLVYDGDEIWVTTVASGQLVRIDPSAASVTGTIDFGTETVDIAYDGTSLWVSLRAQQALVRVDPASGEILDRFDFDRRTGNVAVGADAVWVTLHRPPGASEALVEGVARIDPSTREVQEVAVPQPAGIFLTDDSLWVAQRQDNVVVQIDATTLESAGPTFPVGPAPDPVAVVDDVLWVGNRGTDTVSRIDLATGTTTTHQVDAAPGEILVDGDRVWVLCVDAGTLVLLTAGEGTRLLTQPVGTTTFSQILLDGDLWITVAGSNSVVRVDVS